jgi:acyl carrier protein
MERNELTEKLTIFLKKALANKDVKIMPDVDFKDLGLNSSGRLEFFTMIEDEWNLMFDEDEQDEVNTLNKAVDLVAKMMTE